MQDVNIGVVGIGRIGRMHVDNLVHRVPRARVKAVASPHIDGEWARRLGIPVATTEADEVFQDPDIQAIVIASPSGRHVELVRRAAHFRKHVFCEKPVAFEEEPICRAMDAVDGAGVQLQVGFNRRFDPSICRAAEAVRNGEIGSVEAVRIVNRDPSAPPVDFVRRSGGLFFDFTIHDFDVARFLSGCEIEEVYALGAVLIDPEIGAAGDIDTAVLTLRLDNGALCTIDNSRQTTYGYDQRFEVFGSKGNLVVDNLRSTSMEAFLERGVFADPPLRAFPDRYQDAFIRELAAFVDCVADSEPVAVTGADALAAVRAATSARASMLDNRPVRLASTEAVTGGAGP